MQVTKKLSRREKRAIKKLGHSQSYKKTLGFFHYVFSPVKMFVFLPFSAAKKAFGVISYTVYKVLGLKIAYVDDFIIHKKLRGKGYGKELFTKTQEEIEKSDCDYMILFSRNDRKKSHKFYKKAGLTIIGLGFGIFAYKKITHKK